MNLYSATLTQYLSVATVLGMVVVIGLAVYALYVLFVTKKTSQLLTFISIWVLPLSFALSFTGMLLTLFYSQVLHYVPCELCWYQRIFLYPQVFLFGYAWYKRDRAVLPYTLMLSVVGFCVALYHHMLQIGFDLMKPCSSAPFAVDCAKPSFIEFGFVTFPFMAVVLFGFLSTVLFISLKSKAD